MHARDIVDDVWLYRVACSCVGGGGDSSGSGGNSIVYPFCGFVVAIVAVVVVRLLMLCDTRT